MNLNDKNSLCGLQKNNKLFINKLQIIQLIILKLEASDPRKFVFNILNKTVHLELGEKYNFTKTVKSTKKRFEDFNEFVRLIEGQNQII